MHRALIGALFLVSEVLKVYKLLGSALTDVSLKVPFQW